MLTLRKRGAVAALAVLLLVCGSAAAATTSVREVDQAEATAWERVWSGIRGLLGLDGPRSAAVSADAKSVPKRPVSPPPAAPPLEGEEETDEGGSLDPDG
jgi:hypothetical protein